MLAIRKPLAKWRKSLPDDGSPPADGNPNVETIRSHRSPLHRGSLAPTTLAEHRTENSATAEGPSRGRLLLGNILSNALLRALSMVATLVALRFSVDAWGQSRYGVFSLATNLLGYSTLLGLGIPGALLKHVAECRATGDWRRMSIFVSSSLGFYFGVGLLSACALAGVALWGTHWFRLEPGDVELARRLLLLTAAWSLISWPAQVYGQALMGMQQFRRYNIAGGIQILLFSAASITLALARIGIEALLLALAASQLVAFAMNRRDIAKVAPELRISPAAFSATALRELLSFSAWMLVISMSGMIVAQTGQTLLGLFVSTAAVTLYGILSTPVQAIQQVNILVLSALLPAVSEASAARDTAFLESLVFRGTRAAMAVTIGLIAVAIGAAAPALHVWMGPEAASQAPLCMAMLAAYAYAAGLSVVGQTLIGSGAVRLVGCFALAASAVNVLSGLYLVPRWGIGGVVAAMVLSYLTIAPLSLPMYFRRLGYSLGRFAVTVLLRVYPAAILAGIAVRWSTNLLGEEPRLIPTIALLAVATPLTLAWMFSVSLDSVDRAQARALLHATFSPLLVRLRGSRNGSA